MANESKKVIAAVIGALVIGAGVGFVAHQPATITKEVIKEIPVDKIVEKTVTVEVPVEKIVTKEVVKEVTVEDTEFKTLACDRLHYDILSECVEEVKAEDAALKIAFDKIESDFAVELKDAGFVTKAKYAELVKVYTKFEDITVNDSDFKNSDYEFEIKVKFNDTHNEAKSTKTFTVSVQDDEAKIVDVN